MLVPFIPEKDIANLNRELGRKITEDYRKILAPDEKLLVVITLKGAVIFGADLVREIGVPCDIDFVRLASYGAGTQSGAVRFLKDIECSPVGRHILVLDEIIDSGKTLHFLVEHLQNSQPGSVKLCALLSKPSRREIPVNVEYLGREIPDEFVVGYGLDFNEQYRNLKDICILKN